jgi:hypothetical protein
MFDIHGIECRRSDNVAAIKAHKIRFSQNIIVPVQTVE